MGMCELNLKALMAADAEDGRGSLDGGRIGIAFQHELKRVVADCEDRPADTKPRTVTLTMQIVPVPTTDGTVVTLDSIAAKFQVASSVPKRRSKQYSFGARSGGQLVFNDMSEENVNQRTFD